MKKEKKAALAAIVLMLSVVACGNVAQKQEVWAEEAVSETASRDFLMNSLEYLLSEEKEDVIQLPDGLADDAVVEEAVQREGIKPEVQDLTIYYSNGTFDSLDFVTVEEEKTPEAVVANLAKHNIVSLDTKVLSFWEEEKEGGKVLHLDFSKALDEYLGTMTEEAEGIIVASIVNTFLENYDAEAIYLAIEGEPLASSRVEYDMALQRCTPQDVMEWMKEGK